jgi:hypothetical protein
MIMGWDTQHPHTFAEEDVKHQMNHFVILYQEL